MLGRLLTGELWQPKLNLPAIVSPGAGAETARLFTTEFAGKLCLKWSNCQIWRILRSIGRVGAATEL
jgi:hypothetical protein